MKYYNVKFTFDIPVAVTDEDGEVELTKDAPEEAVKSFQEFKKVEEEQANQAKYLAERCLDGMKE